jgi:hypothetical protein
MAGWWTVEALTARLRKIQHEIGMPDTEMCEFLEDFLRKHTGVEDEGASATQTRNRA